MSGEIPDFLTFFAGKVWDFSRFLREIRLMRVYLGARGGIDAEIRQSDEFVVGEHVGGVKLGTLELRQTIEELLHDGVGGRADRKGD